MWGCLIIQLHASIWGGYFTDRNHLSSVQTSEGPKWLLNVWNWKINKRVCSLTWHEDQHKLLEAIISDWSVCWATHPLMEPKPLDGLDTILSLYKLESSPLGNPPETRLRNWRPTLALTGSAALAKLIDPVRAPKFIAETSSELLPRELIHILPCWENAQVSTCQYEMVLHCVCRTACSWGCVQGCHPNSKTQHLVLETAYCYQPVVWSVLPKNPVATSGASSTDESGNSVFSGRLLHWAGEYPLFFLFFWERGIP